MNAVERLIRYARETGLIEECELLWARNAVLDALGADSDPAAEVPEDAPLASVLDALTDDALRRGALAEGSVVYRDLFDTEIMGREIGPDSPHVHAKGE